MTGICEFSFECWMFPTEESSPDATMWRDSTTKDAKDRGKEDFCSFTHRVNFSDFFQVHSSPLRWRLWREGELRNKDHQRLNARNSHRRVWLGTAAIIGSELAPDRRPALRSIPVPRMRLVVPEQSIAVLKQVPRNDDVGDEDKKNGVRISLKEFVNLNRDEKNRQIGRAHV